MCNPCLGVNGDNLSDVTYGAHQTGMINSDTRSQENFLPLLGEGGKTELISLNPVMGVEPLQEIIFHLEGGGGGGVMHHQH